MDGNARLIMVFSDYLSITKSQQQTSNPMKSPNEIKIEHLKYHAGMVAIKSMLMEVFDHQANLRHPNDVGRSEEIQRIRRNHLEDQYVPTMSLNAFLAVTLKALRDWKKWSQRFEAADLYES